MDFNGQISSELVNYLWSYNQKCTANYSITYQSEIYIDIIHYIDEKVWFCILRVCLFLPDTRIQLLNLHQTPSISMV